MNETDSLDPQMHAPAKPRRFWRRLGQIGLILGGVALGVVISPMVQQVLEDGAPAMMSEVNLGPTGRLRALEQEQAKLARRLDMAAAGGHAGLQGERIARLEGRVEGLAEQQMRVQAKIDGVALDSTRVAERMDDVVRQSSATSASAANDARRVQLVLLVTAVRRLLEQGRTIGAYEPLLRENFGPTHSAEVEAIIALGRAPVTLGQLRQGLAKVQQVGLVAEEDWWGQLKAQMSSLIEIRRGDEYGMGGADARLAIAQRRLAGGDVAGALAQMERLPPVAVRRARQWMNDARRHATGLQAVDSLESATLLPQAALAPANPSARAPLPATTVAPALTPAQAPAPVPAPGMRQR